MRKAEASGQCHLNYRISYQIVSQVWYQFLCNWRKSNFYLVSYHEKNSTISFQIDSKTQNNNKKIAERKYPS